MELVELRNLGEARTYVLQGLWLQCVARPEASLVRPALEWALEIASDGQPLPPIGFVADLGNLVYGNNRGRGKRTQVEVPGWPSAMARNYEDFLLGKIHADWMFERATDALRRYAGRDQAKGLGYVVKQIRERAKLGGVELSPAVIRGLLNVPGDELLKEGYESISRDGPQPLLLRQYHELVRSSRRMGDVLGPEDVIALEQRTALADMGQYVAHRQIVQMMARLEAQLPPRPVRPLAGRKEVPTRVFDEDQYPVGGYASIANRGSIESLLHSQLAYMESHESPDLFDVKFVRDELFYYSRDENQFLRRRRTFVFAFFPDLATARFKDPELPTQRIILCLAVAFTAIRRLTDWLCADALKFELIFIQPGPEKPLAPEVELVQLLLREAIERGAAEIRTLAGASSLEAFCTALGRESQVHCLTLSVGQTRIEPEGAVVTRLTTDAARPSLTDANGVTAEFPADDAFDEWAAVTERILALWV